MTMPWYLHCLIKELWSQRAVCGQVRPLRPQTRGMRELFPWGCPAWCPAISCCWDQQHLAGSRMGPQLLSTLMPSSKMSWLGQILFFPSRSSASLCFI